MKDLSVAKQEYLDWFTWSLTKTIIWIQNNHCEIDLSGLKTQTNFFDLWTELSYLVNITSPLKHTAYKLLGDLENSLNAILEFEAGNQNIQDLSLLIVQDLVNISYRLTYITKDPLAELIASQDCNGTDLDAFLGFYAYKNLLEVATT